MSRSVIPAAKIMPYATFPLKSILASFAYARTYDQNKLISFLPSAQVIIGSNGSGKSTILKLVARIYDPTEGTVFIDGHDIKTLRLEDIRRALAILFQDYTHFPLSVRIFPPF